MKKKRSIIQRTHFRDGQVKRVKPIFVANLYINRLVFRVIWHFSMLSLLPYLEHKAASYNFKKANLLLRNNSCKPGLTWELGYMESLVGSLQYSSLIACLLQRWVRLPTDIGPNWLLLGSRSPAHILGLCGFPTPNHFISSAFICKGLTSPEVSHTAQSLWTWLASSGRQEHSRYFGPFWITYTREFYLFSILPWEPASSRGESTCPQTLDQAGLC